MSPRLVTALAQDHCTLTATATLAEPDVRLDLEPGVAPTLTIEEGGVRVALEFADTECVRRFQHRVGAVAVPAEPSAAEPIADAPRGRAGKPRRT